MRAALAVAATALLLVACGKDAEAPPRAPEEVARDVLEAAREDALGCKRMGAAAEAAFDEGLGAGDDGASQRIAAARAGKVGATMCLAQWSQRVMAAMGRAGVPGPVAKRELEAWLAQHVGGATLPVY